MLHKENQQVYQKGTLGLTVGHGVITLPCWSLWPLRCQKHSGTEASRRGKNGWVDVCLGWLKIIFSNFFFDPWRAKSIHRAGRKQFFWHLSHTPASRNECPYCKPFVTSTTNTSISSLSLKNHISNSSPLQGRRVNRLPGFYTEKSLHKEVLTQRSLHTHRGFYTEKPFTQSSFFTEELLHRGTFTQTSLYTQRLWHREVFYTEKLLHTEAFTQQNLNTEELLHTEAGTQRNFHKQKLLHTEDVYTEAFTHRSFYTKKNLYTEKPLPTEAFTYRSFYSKKLLHTETFTHRSFYTQRSFFTKKLYTEELVHKEACTHRRVYTRIEAFVQRSLYPSFIMSHFSWSFTIWHLDIFVFMLFWSAPSVV